MFIGSGIRIRAEGEKAENVDRCYMYTTKYLLRLKIFFSFETTAMVTVETPP